MQSIYERIEHLIAERGMTKKAFCQQLKISTGNLGDWKRGKSIPSTNKLIEIASFFDVSLDWLMIGRPSKEAMVREKREDYFLTCCGNWIARRVNYRLWNSLLLVNILNLPAIASPRRAEMLMTIGTRKIINLNQMNRSNAKPLNNPDIYSGAAQRFFHCSHCA